MCIRDRVSTVLYITIYHGKQRITDAATMKEVYGENAYLQWKWLRLDEAEYGIISSSDSRFRDDGFKLSLIHIFVSELSKFDSSNISKFEINDLGEAIQSYGDSVLDLNTSTVFSSITAANRLKNFMSSLVGLDTSGVSKFKSCLLYTSWIRMLTRKYTID